MRNIKRLSVIAAILIVIGVIGCLLTFKTAFHTESIRAEKVFTEEIINTISINSEQAEINIIPSSDAETRVELTGKGMNNRSYRLNTEVEDNTLFIDVNEKRLAFFQFHFFTYKYELNVYLPKKAYDSITVNSKNGSLDVEKLRVENVRVDTSNGKIQLKDIESSFVQVQSVNGQVNLNRVTGEVAGGIKNGEFSIITNNLDQNINLESVNGKIKIKAKKDPTNVTIDADVVNGRAELFGKSTNYYIVGNGEHQIHLKTVNGKISVEK